MLVKSPFPTWKTIYDFFEQFLTPFGPGYQPRRVVGEDSWGDQSSRPAGETREKKP